MSEGLRTPRVKQKYVELWLRFYDESNHNDELSNDLYVAHPCGKFEYLSTDGTWKTPFFNRDEVRHMNKTWTKEFKYSGWRFLGELK